MATLIFVHAHPDDEALLTAGTMARASAEGHRVVLVAATDGAAGLTSADFADDLAATRAAELEHSAGLLGTARLVNWAYADSGLHGLREGGFATGNLRDQVQRLVDLIDEEDANILVGYDPSGGYGHPDHLRVHAVVRGAAEVVRGRRQNSGADAHAGQAATSAQGAPPDIATGDAGAPADTTPSTKRLRVFEATLPREPIANAVHAASRLHLTPSGFDPTEFDRAWTPRERITHRVDVRRQLAAKRASMAAHASQAAADDSVRTLAVLTKLPGPIYSRLLGTEYFVEIP